MVDLIVGVGQVTMLLRHSQSLKDKRQIIKSLSQRLKNLGLTVAECGYADNPKRASLGFAFVSGETARVTEILDDAFRFFIGDFEVVDTQRDVFDYSGEDFEKFLEIENNDPRVP